MRTKYLGLAAVLLLPQASQACSCGWGADAAGFVHASLKSLPSNARGAIFLLSEPVTADAFEVTSDRHTGTLPVELSYPQAGRNGPAGVDPGKLLRVGVKGGFQAGATYTVRYTGPAKRWAYLPSHTFLVDAEPLNTSTGYTLVLDGAPLRQMLPFRTNGGSCSAQEPVTVQDFHYAMPASHKPYAGAVMFFSESRQEGESAFGPIVYVSSLCQRDRYSKTARTGGNEFMHLPCDARSGRYSVRGWAGLLEVEDGLQVTNALSVDLETAEGSSCTAFGILKHALNAGDARRIKDAVCAVGRGIQRQFPKLALADQPPVASLLALTYSDDIDVQHCSLRALTKLMQQAPGAPGELVPGYAGVLESLLLSFDAAKVDLAIDQLSDIQHGVHSDQAGDAAGARKDALNLALLLPMRQALVRGTGTRIMDLGYILASMGPKAASVVPALWSAAEGGGASGSAAIRALAGIIPNESRLHDLLIASARDPAMRQAAVFAFADTGGKTRPDDAVALLIQLARDEDQRALDRLAKFGRAARASIPVLIELLENGKHDWSRGNAFSALLSVSGEEPEVIAAINALIIGPEERGIPAYKLAELKKFKEGARVFLPALEQLIAQPSAMNVRYALEPVIRAMGLPASQQHALIARAGVRGAEN